MKPWRDPATRTNVLLRCAECRLPFVLWQHPLVCLLAATVPGHFPAQAADGVTSPDGLLHVRPFDYRRTLRIEVIDDLRFGRVTIAANRGGEIILDPQTGNWRMQGGVYDLGGHRGRAEFSVRGKPGTEFAISLPTTLDLAGNGPPMTVSDLASYPTKAGVVGPDGRATIYVGGTLRIRAKEAPGDYRGSLQVYLDDLERR